MLLLFIYSSAHGWNISTGIVSTVYLDQESVNPIYPYSTIETAANNLTDAVDAINNVNIRHRTVLAINNGTYVLNDDLSLYRYCLHVKGIGDRNNTIIDGNGEYKIKVYDRYKSTSISSIKITNCNGGGIGIGNNDSTDLGEYYSDLSNSGYNGNNEDRSDSISVSNCVISLNYNGPAVSSCIVYNSIIDNNINFIGPGGAGYDSIFYNCLILNNQATEGGVVYDSAWDNSSGGNNSGSFVGFSGQKGLYSCTVVNNQASISAPIINKGFIYNSIIYNDYDNRHLASKYKFNDTSIVTVGYSAIQVHTTTSPYYLLAPNTFGNYVSLNVHDNTLDLAFADYDNSNYQLSSSSELINAGLNFINDSVVDVSHNNRIAGNRIDIGAYEFQGVSSNNITLNIDHSSDLQDWNNTPYQINIQIPSNSTNDFYRLRVINN